MKPFNIKHTSKACSIADNILKQLIKKLKKRQLKTELEVFNFLKQKTESKKHCKLAFPPVVAMGKNAAEIHHEANNTILKKGFLVIDFGVKYKGYCSDCTRTFYLYGKPSRKEKELYEIVLQAQETAILNVRPGVAAADIDLIARAVLWKHYKNFIHGTGHGVGAKIHQIPNLKPRGKHLLRKGMLITVEPGLYFKDKLGIRIEDTILVKEKPEILTKISKELTII
ncbi:M24 family metallopeptidase [Candidatus Woesearchaeota archaeon]|nr:M24 family metallopeptidase [Candidatus Woesearchaeota archaeon]